MSNLPTNENNRVSLHLIDNRTSLCVLDLDCYPDEMPSIVWCEVMRDYYDVADLFLVDTHKHIDYYRENGAYGFQLEEVYKNEEEYNFCWEDDNGRLVLNNELPQVFYCFYKDTALAAK